MPGIPLFSNDHEFQSFEQVIRDTLEKAPIRVLAYCLQRDHWQLVLWPKHNDDMRAFMQLLSSTHVRRWQRDRELVGSGSVYSSRFKSFPVQADDHLLQVIRYVERNPVRADLVRAAEDWPYSSLWIHQQGTEIERAMLASWPVSRPTNWLKFVNTPELPADLEILNKSCRRGTPYGDARWTSSISKRLGLGSTLRPHGRPTAQVPSSATAGSKTKKPLRNKK